MDENLSEKKEEKKASFTDYLPLLFIILFSLFGAYAFSERLIQFSWKIYGSLFMGLFFFLLSLFKFFDIKGFAQGFSSYDIPSQKFPPYAYVYPFLELLLSFLYLSSWVFYVTNILTIIIMGISALGVIRAVSSHRDISCACMGTVIKVPLTTLSIIENLGMGLMAFFMLF